MRFQAPFAAPRALVVAPLLFLLVPASALRAADPAPVASHASVAPLTQPAHKPIGNPPGQSGVVARGTFNKEIVRILQARCQTCHHAGDIAPFPLTTYREAYPYRDQIRRVTSARVMPPWHVANSCSKFEGDPSLTDLEIRTIAGWVAGGAPEGDARDLPSPINFGNGWKLGTPDLQLTMPEAFTPNFSSGDVYRCFVLPTNLAEDRWVKSVEVKPSVRAMVHHVLLFIDTGNSSTVLDANEPGPGYTCFGGPGFNISVDTGLLAGWAPGARALELPDGVGILLPKGSKVVMQVHYSSRAGVVAPDATTVGINYTTAPVHKRFRTFPLVNQTFKIPPGASDYPVTVAVPIIPIGLHILSVFPHMHLLGQTMNIEVTALDGVKTCLVEVPDWDFQWQGNYAYQEPVGILPGMRIDLRATYDNSSRNPENPNIPPKEVGWGENTTDEMCLAFLGVTLDYENLVANPGQAQTTLKDVGIRAETGKE